MEAEHALVLTIDDPNWAATDSPDRLRAALEGIGLPEGVGAFEVFAPHPEFSRFTMFGDGPPPFTIVEFRARAPEPLRRMAGDARVQQALRAAASQHGSGAGSYDGSRAGMFRVLSEALPRPAATRQPDSSILPRAPGANEPTANAPGVPLALLVHYYGPTDDPEAFAAHYVAHHPPLLARFPRVREVLCYLPASPIACGLPEDPTVIRNEVRFDSMDDLLAALGSPVMPELRADTKGFPRFGRSTHFPMRRG